MLGLTPQAHEVPSCWGRTETAFPWIQHPNVGSMETTTARAFHRKSLTQAALNGGSAVSHYWRIKPLRCFSPCQRCCEMLILPGTVQNTGLQGIGNWELPGYNQQKIAELQLLG